MLRLALRNYSVLLENKIFLVEGERTCFQLKVGLSTEATSFSWCLASLVSSFTPNDMLKHVENETTLQKTVKSSMRRFWKFWSKALMGVSAGPKFDMGVRQNWTYLLGENMKIVSKRVSELPFFFDLCVRKNFWERTNKFECCFFGWVSLTRLKFNTSFFWSYKTVIGFWFDL